MYIYIYLYIYILFLYIFFWIFFLLTANNNIMQIQNVPPEKFWEIGENFPLHNKQLVKKIQYEFEYELYSLLNN